MSQPTRVRNWVLGAMWVVYAAFVLPGARGAHGDSSNSAPAKQSYSDHQLNSPFTGTAVPQALRERAFQVVDHPTVSSHGPAQAFPGDPSLYLWLLDHPTQGVAMWRRLGAQCLDIRDTNDGGFGWSDGIGSQVHWRTIVRTGSLRVWYAEGSVRPALFLPQIPVRAVVVLHHGVEECGSSAASVIHHQADLYFQTDSLTAAAITRLLGHSAPRLAEQCVTQLETFYSALVWYLAAHPEQAASLRANRAPRAPHPIQGDGGSLILSPASGK